VRARPTRLTTAALAAALLLGACADAGNDDEAAPEEAATEETDGNEDPAPDEGEAGEDGAEELDPDELEDLLAEQQQDIEDPNEDVEDGVYRGQGIVMPVPDGYSLDPTAFMQGLLAAVTADGSNQIAAQAVDQDTLPEPIDITELIESNSAQFGEPSLNESIEVDGAEEARQVRYDTLPAQQEGQPDLTLLLIAADNGDGRLAIFNYVAPADEYDDEAAQQILSTVGFDPNSDPAAPAPPTAP